jgi:hypothetical protein
MTHAICEAGAAVVVALGFEDHMRMTYARVLMLFYLAAVAVSACHGDAGTPATAAAPTPRPNAAPPVKKGPSAADLTAGMVEAAAQGNSSVPVLLKFDLPHKPQIGKALQVDIAVMPQIAASPAAIQITGTEGLEVASDTSKIEIPAVESGEVYRQSLKVTPTMDGVLLLGLTVSLKHDEITESRGFSIPLIVDR